MVSLAVFVQFLQRCADLRTGFTHVPTKFQTLTRRTAFPGFVQIFDIHHIHVKTVGPGWEVGMLHLAVSENTLINGIDVGTIRTLKDMQAFLELLFGFLELLFGFLLFFIFRLQIPGVSFHSESGVRAGY